MPSYSFPIDYGRSLSVGMNAYNAAQESARRDALNQAYLADLAQRRQLGAIQIAQIQQAERERQQAQGLAGAIAAMPQETVPGTPEQPAVSATPPGYSPGLQAMTAAGAVSAPTPPPPDIAGTPGHAAIPAEPLYRKPLTFEDVGRQIGPQNMGLASTSPITQAVMKARGVMTADEAQRQNDQRAGFRKAAQKFGETLDIMKEGDPAKSASAAFSMSAMYMAYASVVDPAHQKDALDSAQRWADFGYRMQQDPREQALFAEASPKLMDAYKKIATGADAGTKASGIADLFDPTIQRSATARAWAEKIGTDTMAAFPKMIQDGKISEADGAFMTTLASINAEAARKGYMLSPRDAVTKALMTLPAGIRGSLSAKSRETIDAALIGSKATSQDQQTAIDLANQAVPFGQSGWSSERWRAKFEEEYGKLTTAKRETSSDRLLKAARVEYYQNRGELAQAQSALTAAKTESQQTGGVLKPETINNLTLSAERVAKLIESARIDQTLDEPGRAALMREWTDVRSQILELIKTKRAGGATTDPEDAPPNPTDDQRRAEIRRRMQLGQQPDQIKREMTAHRW